MLVKFCMSMTWMSAKYCWYFLITIWKQCLQASSRAWTQMEKSFQPWISNGRQSGQLWLGHTWHFVHCLCIWLYMEGSKSYMEWYPMTTLTSQSLTATANSLSCSSWNLQKPSQTTIAFWPASHRALSRIKSLVASSGFGTTFKPSLKNASYQWCR